MVSSELPSPSLQRTKLNSTDIDPPVLVMDLDLVLWDGGG